jgi:tetratricopeptide (TPR) repeat protein
MLPAEKTVGSRRRSPFPLTLQRKHMKLVPPILALVIALGLTGCNSAESQMLRGDAYSQASNYSLALEQYLSARTKDPSLSGIDQRIQTARLRVEIQRGDQAVERKEWDLAERAYNEARRIEPSSSEVGERLKQMATTRANEHFQRGQQLLGRGNPFDAIAEFEQALTFQPDHPRAQAGLDRAIEEKRDRESQAESAFQDGMRALTEEKHESAIQSLTASVNLNPHHPKAERELANARSRYAEALVAEGDAAVARKHWQEAGEFYRKALAQKPGMAGVAQQMRRSEREARGAKLVDDGNRAFERGDWRTAFERFSQAHELTSEPEAFASRLNTARENLASDTYTLAQSAERGGNLEEALARYRTIAQFSPRYRDVEERAERLDVTLRTARRAFDNGCRAQEEGNLREAREQFRICANIFPGYKGVAEKQRAVDEAFAKAESLYTRGAQAEGRGDNERARVLYEECLAIASPFRDAADRLARVRDALMERADLKQRYEEACQAQAARDLERAKKLFGGCQTMQPGYQDVEARLRDVETALRAARDIYERAVQAEDQCNLERAKTLHEEALATCSPLADAQERLKRVRFAMERLDEGRGLERERRILEAQERYQLVLERCKGHAEARGAVDRIESTIAQLKKAYESMLEAQRKGNFPQAFSYAADIRKHCIGFRDVDDRALLLESEVDYAHASALEDDKKHREALEKFERCLKRTPDFRDVKDRIRGLREKVAREAADGAGGSKR